MSIRFFLGGPATTAVYTLSYTTLFRSSIPVAVAAALDVSFARRIIVGIFDRSEEHTSELQSRFDIVCRLLLEKKNGTPSAPGRSSAGRAACSPGRNRRRFAHAPAGRAD